MRLMRHVFLDSIQVCASMYKYVRTRALRGPPCCALFCLSLVESYTHNSWDITVDIVVIAVIAVVKYFVQSDVFNAAPADAFSEMRPWWPRFV